MMCYLTYLCEGCVESLKRRNLSLNSEFLNLSLGFLILVVYDPDSINIAILILDPKF